MRVRDYITGETFTIRPAAEGWWLTSPAPADLAPYYGSTYYGAAGRRRFPTLVEWGQSLLYRRRARRITAAMGQPGRVLDVGCGPGHLLARLRELGWTAMGTEASASSAAIPRRKHQLDVRIGEVYDQEFGADEFDAVVSWHSLEHMREPARALDEFARLLKPGGVLLVSVPDFASPEATAQPAAWFHLDVPRHLCHFPAAVLRDALEQRGLTIEWESRNAPEYDAFSLLQTWQNRLGLPHNLLYLLLKSARPGCERRATAGQQAAAWALGVLLFPAALALASWRACRGTGAVVVFLARKIARSPGSPHIAANHVGDSAPVARACDV